MHSSEENFVPTLSVPLHYKSIHDALTTFKLPTEISQTEARLQLASSELQATQKAYMRTVFNSQVAEMHSGSKQATNARNAHTDMTYTMSCTILSHVHEKPVEISSVDTVLVPDDTSRQAALRMQLRLLANKAAIWPQDMQDSKMALAQLVSSEQGFSSGWTCLPGDTNILHKSIKLHDLSAKIFLRPHTFKVQTSLPTTRTLELQRCANETDMAMQCMGVQAQTTVLHVSSLDATNGIVDFTMQVICTPCCAEKKALQKLQYDAYVPCKNSDASNNTALAISVAGIRHDNMAQYPIGICKQFDIGNVALSIHPFKGAHEMDVCTLGMQKILNVAKLVAEIHMMTQIGKTILKTRPHKTPDIAALTSEQKGYHLKDEIKLCNYWDSIRRQMTSDEIFVLDNALRSLIPGNIQYTIKNGEIHSACTPINRSLAQSSHSLQTTVNIKGNLSFPCRELQCKQKFLTTRIDNDWNLECNLVCYN
jgi:hypothetical protein